jgi:hypothetical protein
MLHKKKSGGLKSGDHGDHNLFEMWRPGNRFQVSHVLRDFLNTLYISRDDLSGRVVFGRLVAGPGATDLVRYVECLRKPKISYRYALGGVT